MTCTLDKETLNAVVDFHGHHCPGLTIGVRVSELARTLLDIHTTPNTLCVTETDMCAVDAIQFLTGCSFGKGNLVHRDFGKSAFTFFNRDTGKGARILFKDSPAGRDMDREQRIKMLMDADLDDLLDVQDIDAPPVRPARILTSIVCDACGESTMESRVRLFEGKKLCTPCFQRVEQKI
jgi:formylmethanofuran dehydrogenase subunit E